ncbi:HotDog domain-containing protein [Pavlovales sp. CCMP2436]|nr:HotDog domain-containing protein [Pavlovales sp. CCMP2436]
MAKRESLWVPPGGRGVFGGQVVGLALHACELTVEPGRVCHSLHSYFVMPGDPNHDIIFNIGRSSDRRSFATRSVQAVQYGKIIFQAEISFCNADEKSSMSHQLSMPDPEPNPNDDLHPDPHTQAATQHIWVKVKQRLNDSPHVHRASAAYFSDHALLATALRPHGVNFPSPKLGAMASLDHSMWFHSSSFRADEWMLYSMHSPWAGNGRGLSFGHLYDASGKLHVSCAQEGVMRLARPSPRRYFADSALSAIHLLRRCSAWLVWSSPKPALFKAAEVAADVGAQTGSAGAALKPAVEGGDQAPKP